MVLLNFILNVIFNHVNLSRNIVSLNKDYLHIDFDILLDLFVKSVFFIMSY